MTLQLSKFIFRAKSIVQNFKPETNRKLTVEDRAATVIQKAFRGYLQRKLFLLELNELFLDRDQTRAFELEVASEDDLGRLSKKLKNKHSGKIHRCKILQWVVQIQC